MNNQNNKIIYAVVGLIVGLILGLTTGSSFQSGQTVNQNIPKGDAVTQAARLIDQHFIEQMIPHHEGAIAMAALAFERAERPEIKTLAQAITQAQEAENLKMRGWYRDWFGRDVPSGNTMMGGMMSRGGMHMGGSEDLAVLNAAPDFDQEFIEQMIPHHQMAIMMAQMLKTGSDRPEMKELADNIISSQTAEIERMQKWYNEWYQ